MRTVIVTVLLIALSATVGCSGGTPPMATTTQHTGDPPPGWKRYYAVGFSVCVPEGCKFDLKDKEVMRSRSASGKENVLRSYSGLAELDTPDRSMFLVMTFLMTPDLAADVGRDKAAAWAKQMNLYAGVFSMLGRSVELDPGTDYPVPGGEGKQATWSGKTFRGEHYGGGIRMIVKGEWMLFAMTENKLMTDLDHPTVKPFLDSLRID